MVGNETLMDFSNFRKKNGLLQQDIAELLQVSSSYISMVEKGKSKLSRTSIDKLYEASFKNGWDITYLVPAYSRLIGAINYINRIVEETQGIYEEGNPDTYSIPDKIMDRIKYAEIEIPDAIVDDIIRHAPDIQRDWLVSGIGTMEKTGPITDHRTIEEKIYQEQVKIRHLLELLCEKNNINFSEQNVNAKNRLP